MGFDRIVKIKSALSHNVQDINYINICCEDLDYKNNIVINNLTKKPITHSFIRLHQPQNTILENYKCVHIDDRQVNKARTYFL